MYTIQNKQPGKTNVYSHVSKYSSATVCENVPSANDKTNPVNGKTRIAIVSVRIPKVYPKVRISGCIWTCGHVPYIIEAKSSEFSCVFYTRKKIWFFLYFLLEHFTISSLNKDRQRYSASGIGRRTGCVCPDPVDIGNAISGNPSKP